MQHEEEEKEEGKEEDEGKLYRQKLTDWGAGVVDRGGKT